MKHIDWKFNLTFALGAMWALFSAADFSLDQSALWGVFAVLMLAFWDVLFKGILFHKNEVKKDG